MTCHLTFTNGATAHIVRVGTVAIRDGKLWLDKHGYPLERIQEFVTLA